MTDNPNKWEIRARRGKEVIVTSRRFINTSEGQLKKYQSEFQSEFCESCISWANERNTFIQIGHPNNPIDCIDHWCDIIGQCWNYRRKA